MEALPSFLGHKDVQINVPELGKVNTKHLHPAPINPMAYLIFIIFLHRQNFWRIKFTPIFTQ